MDQLPNYDAWKLASPPEPKGSCGECGESADNCTCREFTERDPLDDGDVAYDTMRDRELENECDEAKRETATD